MSLFVESNQKQFAIAEEGTQPVVLAAVQDLGIIEGKFGPKDTVRFVWMVNEKDPETGTPILILQGMTKSLHEKATLGKTLRGLLGTNDLPKSLDLEKLVGTQGFATVIHTDSNDGRTYANILKVKKAAANQPVVKIPTGWHAPNVKPVRTSTASASTAGTAGTTGTAGATNDEETVF